MYLVDNVHLVLSKHINGGGLSSKCQGTTQPSKRILTFPTFGSEPPICDREDDQRRQLPFDTCQSSYFAKMKYIHSKETLTIPDGGTFALAKETLCIF